MLFRSKALNIEIGSNRVSNHLADQVNALNDASTELAKELGREATLEELCERLALSTDEVKELYFTDALNILKRLSIVNSISSLIRVY